MSTTNALSDVVNIEAAAKHVGMRRDYFRDLAIKAGIAIRWGGTEEHPRLKVKISDAERVVLNQRYVPAAKGAAKRSRLMRPAPHGQLHPDVRC